MPFGLMGAGHEFDRPQSMTVDVAGAYRRARRQAAQAAYDAAAPGSPERAALGQALEAYETPAETAERMAGQAYDEAMSTLTTRRNAILGQEEPYSNRVIGDMLNIQRDTLGGSMASNVNALRARAAGAGLDSGSVGLRERQMQEALGRANAAAARSTYAQAAPANATFRMDQQGQAGQFDQLMAALQAGREYEAPVIPQMPLPTINVEPMRTGPSAGFPQYAPAMGGYSAGPSTTPGGTAPKYQYGSTAVTPGQPKLGQPLAPVKRTYYPGR